jgi:hypothetical protein
MGEVNERTRRRRGLNRVWRVWINHRIAFSSVILDPSVTISGLQGSISTTIEVLDGVESGGWWRSGMTRDSGVNFTYEVLYAIIENLRLVSGKIPNGSAVATLKRISIERPESADYDSEEQESLHGKACAIAPSAQIDS